MMYEIMMKYASQNDLIRNNCKEKKPNKSHFIPVCSERISEPYMNICALCLSLDFISR